MAIYFGVYNHAKDKGYNTLEAGGLAGLANWTATYPIDVVKTRQIAQQVTVRQAIAGGGLWKGYPVCATRAVVVNAAVFWVYESVKASQW